MKTISISPATSDDVPVILDFIRRLAEFEKLEHEVTTDEAGLRHSLFTLRAAEVVFAAIDGRKVGLAIFFHNFSTFLGRPGIYLEDLFVLPECRGLGAGKALLAHLAKLTVDRQCGRLEWAVLDWNQSAIDFYKSLGAQAMREWDVYRLTGDSLKQLASFTRCTT